MNHSNDIYKDYGWINAMTYDQERQFWHAEKFHSKAKFACPKAHRTVKNVSTGNNTHYKCSCGFEYRINHDG